jgi:hypothetical protein
MIAMASAIHLNHIPQAHIATKMNRGLESMRRLSFAVCRTSIHYTLSRLCPLFVYLSSAHIIKRPNLYHSTERLSVPQIRPIDKVQLLYFEILILTYGAEVMRQLHKLRYQHSVGHSHLMDYPQISLAVVANIV